MENTKWNHNIYFQMYCAYVEIGSQIFSIVGQLTIIIYIIKIKKFIGFKIMFSWTLNVGENHAATFHPLMKAAFRHLGNILEK